MQSCAARLTIASSENFIPISNFPKTSSWQLSFGFPQKWNCSRTLLHYSPVTEGNKQVFFRGSYKRS